jgi:anaerobic ribonucleoside-triphosphate reductase
MNILKDICRLHNIKIKWYYSDKKLLQKIKENSEIKLTMNCKNIIEKKLEEINFPDCIINNNPKKERKIPVEKWSRVVGYFRPVSQWNKGKQEEFKDRNYHNSIKEL